MRATMTPRKRDVKPPSKGQIKSLRERMDKTQAEMAELIGVSWRTWIGYELGDRKPSAPVAILIRKLIEENP